MGDRGHSQLRRRARATALNFPPLQEEFDEASTFGSVKSTGPRTRVHAAVCLLPPSSHEWHTAIFASGTRGAAVLAPRSAASSLELIIR